MANTWLAGVKEKATAELRAKIEEMERDNFSCKIKLVYESSAVLIGSYELGAIDVADVAAFPKEGRGATRYGVFVHELVEQWEKQKNQSPYQTAHQEGIYAEAGVTGGGYRAGEDGAPGASGASGASGRPTRIILTYHHVKRVVVDRDGERDVKTKVTEITQTVIINGGNVISVK